MTMLDKLQDAKIEIIFVDPWDFVTGLGSGPFIATVIRTGKDNASKDMLLLQLDEPKHYKGDEYRYFVAGTRHDHSTFAQLLGGATVGVNLTRIPTERANVVNPFDLSWWRGGGAAIADVTLIQDPSRAGGLPFRA